jgi:uncharacterized membrane protein YbhN (UPF0104 family)
MDSEADSRLAKPRAASTTLQTEAVPSVGAKPEAISRAELSEQPPLDRSTLRRRALSLLLAVAVIVAAITLIPGLAGLRSRFAHASWEWLALGVVLKLLSGLCYVVVFRSVFCATMSWRVSSEIGLSELGANALIPTGGAGGLALGAWALRRTGMDARRIARRSVAFFLLTSVPNVLGVIVLGLGLAAGIFEGETRLVLTLLPALVAIAAIVVTIGSGRWAARARERLAERHGTDARRVIALGALSEGVDESLALLRHPSFWMLSALLGYLAFDVMVLWATFHAFGPAPPLSIIWIAYLIGELGGLIPTPGGLGGVDLGLVGMLVLYHVPVGEATAAVLGYRAIALWVPAVVGSGAFMLLRRTLRHESAAIASCEPGGEIEVIGRGAVRVTA